MPRKKFTSVEEELAYRLHQLATDRKLSVNEIRRRHIALVDWAFMKGIELPSGKIRGDDVDRDVVGKTQDPVSVPEQDSVVKRMKGGSS